MSKLEREKRRRLEGKQAQETYEQWKRKKEELEIARAKKVSKRNYEQDLNRVLYRKRRRRRTMRRN